MKIQQIANTSINTRENGQKDSIKFSGIASAAQNKSMPSFGAGVQKASLNEAKTLFQEFENLFSTGFNLLKKSYEKSEIKRFFGDKIAGKLDKITSKSPKLTQAAKGAAVVTAGVGAFEYSTNKLNIFA